MYHKGVYPCLAGSNNSTYMKLCITKVYIYQCLAGSNNSTYMKLCITNCISINVLQGLTALVHLKSITLVQVSSLMMS